MPLITGAAMVGAAAIGAGGSMYASSQSAAASKDMYKKRYQWQVKDLQKAGLNPMLAYMNPAPVPNQPHVENVGEGAIRGASSALQIKQAFAQSKLIDEQANLARTTANKEAAVGQMQEMQNAVYRSDPLYQNAIKAGVESGFKGTSATAQERFDAGTLKMKADADAARSVAEKAGIEVKRAQNDYEREVALKPLEIAHQEFVNKGLKLGLSQKEADAQFYELLGGWAKGSGVVAEAAKLYMMYLKAK